jgi:serine/threonine-protein kinase HipA
VGAWESVVGRLAQEAGLVVAEGSSRRFGSPYHTFLSRRFDRDRDGRRLHFASALTLLKRRDGDNFATGASYLELVQFILQNGSRTQQDLEQLWRRIVFFMCISNVDDHLRNHGFMLEPSGWRLSPAYDMNPVETGNGLSLNISETDNSQDLALAKEVAEHFQLKRDRADEIIHEIVRAVRQWRNVADAAKLSSAEQDRMEPAFRVADQD